MQSTFPWRDTMAKKQTTEVITHILVPEHILLNEKEKNAILEKYNVTLSELPKIFVTDVAIVPLGVKPGDVIKIVKKSQTAGETVYYRGVISE